MARTHDPLVLREARRPSPALLVSEPRPCGRLLPLGGPCDSGPEPPTPAAEAGSWSPFTLEKAACLRAGAPARERPVKGLKFRRSGWGGGSLAAEGACAGPLAGTWARGSLWRGLELAATGQQGNWTDSR